LTQEDRFISEGRPKMYFLKLFWEYVKVIVDSVGKEELRRQGVDVDHLEAEDAQK